MLQKQHSSYLHTEKLEPSDFIGEEPDIPDEEVESALSPRPETPEEYRQHVNGLKKRTIWLPPSTLISPPGLRMKKCPMP
jgi:hypothetical protein